LAEDTIGAGGLAGFGAATHSCLWRLRRGGNQVRDEIGVRAGRGKSRRLAIARGLQSNKSRTVLHHLSLFVPKRDIGVLWTTSRKRRAAIRGLRKVSGIFQIL
jgi:hypothetical protein